MSFLLIANKKLVNSPMNPARHDWALGGILLVLLLGTAVSCAQTPKQASASIIKVAVPMGNPPWLYRDSSGELKGVAFNTMELLLDATGASPKILPYENVVRIAAEIVKGTIDAGPVLYGEFGAYIASSKLSCTEQPYGMNSAYLYALDDSDLRPVEDLSSLYHVRIATSRVIDVYRYLPGFPKQRVITVKNPETALKMLLSGRSQLLLTTPSSMKFWAHHRGIAFKPIYKVGDYRVHLCFSHASLGDDVARQYAQQANANIPKMVKALKQRR